ncbi:uncharacterized protein LOC131941432 isoform X2 [Physella acuta]|uniref:uncharacterized protein LOC131941432 isoform X2 n=1 Tax=Physella acuta TaxID=109671 RepID=UPI0027DABD88|nr:uncharacterized protein LOC131941432 isoform X2 [Physella acuta]
MDRKQKEAQNSPTEGNLLLTGVHKNRKLTPEEDSNDEGSAQCLLSPASSSSPRDAKRKDRAVSSSYIPRRSFYNASRTRSLTPYQRDDDEDDVSSDGRSKPNTEEMNLDDSSFIEFSDLQLKLRSPVLSPRPDAFHASNVNSPSFSGSSKEVKRSLFPSPFATDFSAGVDYQPLGFSDQTGQHNSPVKLQDQSSPQQKESNPFRQPLDVASIGVEFVGSDLTGINEATPRVVVTNQFASDVASSNPFPSGVAATNPRVFDLAGSSQFFPEVAGANPFTCELAGTNEFHQGTLPSDQFELFTFSPPSYAAIEAGGSCKLNDFTAGDEACADGVLKQTPPPRIVLLPPAAPAQITLKNGPNVNRPPLPACFSTAKGFRWTTDQVTSPLVEHQVPPPPYSECLEKTSPPTGAPTQISFITLGAAYGDEDQYDVYKTARKPTVSEPVAVDFTNYSNFFRPTNFSRIQDTDTSQSVQNPRRNLPENSDHQGLAFISCLFCWPVGLVAIYYSNMCRILNTEGQYEQANVYSRLALIASMTALGSGIIAYMFMFIYEKNVYF